MFQRAASKIRKQQDGDNTVPHNAALRYAEETVNQRKNSQFVARTRQGKTRNAERRVLSLSLSLFLSVSVEAKKGDK